MPRGTNPRLVAHLARKQTSIITMVSLDIRNDPAYLHTDIGSFAWNGKTWIGVGLLGEAPAIQEDDSLDAKETVLTLRMTGPESIDFVSSARNAEHEGRDAVVYAAARDMVTGNLIGEPQGLIEGTMQKMTFDVGDEVAVASVHLVDVRSLLNRTISENMSNEHQQRRHTGDLALSFMARSASFNETWGPGGPPARSGRDRYQDDRVPRNRWR